MSPSNIRGNVSCCDEVRLRCTKTLVLQAKTSNNIAFFNFQTNCKAETKTERKKKQNVTKLNEMHELRLQNGENEGGRTMTESGCPRAESKWGKTSMI